jgi:hypothetical protein
MRGRKTAAEESPRSGTLFTVAVEMEREGEAARVATVGSDCWAVAMAA